MQSYRGYYQSETVDVQASDTEAARNMACEKFRAIHPENKRIRPFLVAIVPLDSADNVAGKVPE